MSTRHGNLTNDPNVFNSQLRIQRLNHYGKDSLGNSNLSTFTDIFTNTDSAHRQTETSIAQNFNAPTPSGRSSIVASSGNSGNPDFPGGSVTYNFNYVAKLNKIPYDRSDSIKVISNLSGLANKANFTGEEINNNADTVTLDRTGKYTPNLNVSFDRTTQDFAAYANVSKQVPDRTNKGGFGSDTTIGSQIQEFRGGDIHTNEETGIIATRSPMTETNSVVRSELGQYTNTIPADYKVSTEFDG